MTHFLLALCAPGAEPALKHEARTAGFASGFQRPGFVTFKSPEAVNEETRFSSVFARHTALSLGRIPRDELSASVRALRPTHVHVVSTQRDDDIASAAVELLHAELLSSLDGGAAGHQTSEHSIQHSIQQSIEQKSTPNDPQESAQDPRQKQVRPSERRMADAASPRRPQALHVGDRIATVVMVDDDTWLSIHRHRADRSPFPGGRMGTPLPASVPSRAWLKLEEAAATFGLELRPGQTALEFGSAPGGATQALLTRGLRVVGVDPNPMDPTVLANPRFVHHRTTSMNLHPGSVPAPHWVLLDVNVPPRTALRGVLPFVKHHASTIQGIVFTLKMKDWSIVGEISDWLRRIQSAAPFLELRARQLSSNGQEICVVGRRRPSAPMR